MEISNYLKVIPIFSQINQDEIKKISDIAKERFYKKGNIIIGEGDKGDRIFIIKTGKVKIYKTSLDGREVILDIKNDGSVFGEVVLFNDINYPASVEAIEDTNLYVIKNEDIEEIIKNNSDIALEIIKVLNRRLHDAQKKLKNMALNDTYVRTAQLLIKLSTKYGKDTKDGLEIDLRLTREELASLAGTSRETVSRALSQFNKENAIIIKGRKIIVIDKEKLKKWLI